MVTKGDAQGPVGVPPRGSATDSGDCGETWGMWRVVVPLGSGDNGCRGDPPHWGVHQEAAVNQAKRVACCPIYELCM